MASYKQNVFIFLLCISLFFFVPIKINLVKRDFDQFLTKYNKSYNSTEYSRRLEIFEKSMDVIKQYNIHRDDNLSALYGVTEFTDLIPEKLLSNQYYAEYSPEINREHFMWSSKLNIPIQVDWRNRGVVSEVNNQWDCGACYAFTTIENIESANAIKNGKLEKFSVQQLIDCSVVSNGCNGGEPCILLEWIKFNNVSIMTEKDYPLHLVTEQCKLTNMSNGIYITSFKCENLINREEVILKYLANIGPVIAVVNAAPWHYYIEGIIRYHCDGSPMHINHAVQIVGYDMSSRVPYYIVRNSWGRSFGVEGYLKIAIGQNMCGIASKVATISI